MALRPRVSSLTGSFDALPEECRSTQGVDLLLGVILGPASSTPISCREISPSCTNSARTWMG